MTKSSKLLRTLLAVGATLLLPLQFAAAQGPWVDQQYPAYSGGFVIYSRLTLPGPTSVWGFRAQSGPGSDTNSNHQIIFSPDDGQTWQNRRFPASLRDACTTDGLHSWALNFDAGSKAIQLLYTATGPAALAPLPTAPPQDARLIRFFSNENGVIVGDPGTATTWPLYRTTNGGASWTAVALPPPRLANDVSGSTANLCQLGNSLWVPTSGRQLLFTHDQGQIWQTATLPTTGAARSLAFSNATSGLLLTDKRELLTTTDGGKTWTPIAPTGALHYAGGIVAVPGTNTYLSFGFVNTINPEPAAYGTALSVDGGLSWRTLDKDVLFASMAASSATRAWAGEYTTAKLYRTSSLVLGSTNARPQAAALAYPNPGTGQFRLAPATHPRHLTLTDALGRQQRELTLPAGATALDLSGCRPGLYVLTSTAQGQTQTQRLVLTAP
ncbi:T9SS type A sorting domain-containing protein [Hymenobacter psychrophilus]|uniref:Por secretion system C-terminal sorting domain-containing protein n=1 Tax=Hymenobacter psychrophilus TaxID=651662 RepID=A0A1H3II01_9BACT|nr:T9SS type A sorting domain-containing protein [Hymenobacter psychrophilus]SDY27310.1 Por secretion system C-terminal sorting domain-containing protein [Hymenobacter psychrophilus]